jgi:hypothetical protein
MTDNDEEVIDLYESRPGEWEHSPPPAHPNPRKPDPVQPAWAREMQENTAGCMPVFWLVMVTIAVAYFLIEVVSPLVYYFRGT